MSSGVPAPPGGNEAQYVAPQEAQYTVEGQQPMKQQRPAKTFGLLSVIAGGIVMLVVGALACLGIVSLTQSSGPMGSQFCRDHLALQQLEAEGGELFGVAEAGDLFIKSVRNKSSKYNDYDGYKDYGKEFTIFAQTFVKTKAVPVLKRLADSANKSKKVYRAAAQFFEDLSNIPTEYASEFNDRVSNVLVAAMKGNNIDAIEAQKAIMEDLESCEIK